MKQVGLFLLMLLFGFNQTIKSQSTLDTISGNRISALINDEGRLFQDFINNSPGYEFPAGSQLKLIFNAGFWFGGTNQNGDLKLAAQYYTVNKDFYRGPYSTTGNYLDTAYMYGYQSGIWTVRKSEIIYHIDNFNQQGYVAPNAILNWPGNGDPTLGVSEQLAPYVDVNNNEVYEPHLGDYPCIKGDVASYQIMHDDGMHYASGGEKIGAEIHMMIYQFQSNNYIDSTTFIEISVINRGQNSFNDFKSTFYLDTDIGTHTHDYIGSDPSKNLMYSYKGGDDSQGQQPVLATYGINPPAIGIMSLNKSIQYSGTIVRPDFSPIPSTPTLPADYWNYMNGKWMNGDEWTYGGDGFGGTVPTQHLYDGNPYLGTGWTELDTDGNGTANQPTDRNILMSTVSESFTPGDTLVYNYAIIVNRRGDTLENVQGVIDIADSVQNYFDNATYSCIEQGTGIADIFEEEEKNLNLNFEITRLDGEGNMSRAVTFHKWTEENILIHNSLDKVRYARGKGPIEARLTDTINHAVGHFVLKFNEYVDVNTANWTVFHYDSIGGMLIDSVNSTSTIEIGNEQLIPQWGMAIRIKQENYICGSLGNQCAFRDRIAQPLETTLTFENANNEWLTGVKNLNQNTPLNWIMSGPNTNSTSNPPLDSIFGVHCYNSNGYDPYNIYSNLLNGIVAPSKLARFNDCLFSPLAAPNGMMNSYNSIAVLNMPPIYHPSIDVVFTDDTSKWTRSPVIELNKDESTSINGGKAGLLRQSSSVNKLGVPDGSGVGMGWFPGYAIDVETGRRLNIAFCENSTLTSDNGNDMIWNPTERLYDHNGNHVLGGQHVIYIFGGEEMGMPNYDEGAFIHQELSAQTSDGYKNVYANLSWVMQPLLKSGEQLNSSEARMRIRINKEFKTKILSNQNEGRPMFSWDAVPYDEIWLSISDEPKIGTINIFPNPATNQITIVWNEVRMDVIKITSYNGRVVKVIPLNGENSIKGEKIINLNGLSSGVYFVNVGSEVRKLVIH
ncbi:T9SS type A sorting domain-containing protein [Brumimicrobium mesophilum]|uniref:T9SS type A sorting domain-containing protein n=1 Tax=Brumimicrobium mesophilum TaxID=392717 RepID=UPI000D13F92E|nr:T9SS type A sorting domain-containing protein [Brumimicrobium mesophilum]